jgi:hypothetical protein
MRSIAFLQLYALAAATPMPQTGSSDSIGSDDPSATDPTTPPKSITFPVARTPSLAPINTQPSQCDAQNPSQDCFNALSGGYLWFAQDSQCDDGQKAQLETAVWDATTLASYSSLFPNAGDKNHGLGAARFYLGPDYAQFQSRIGGNLNRVSLFENDNANSREYITVSCQDTKNQCGRLIDRKAVGGYGWSAQGWLGYWYHYITLCPPFFSLETLDTKLNDVEQELANGVTRMAKDMTWLRTTGQFLLHEMMHTRLADGGVEPHINDEYVNPGGLGPRAYGPKLVNRLAARPLNLGGGATRSSTNADSYAILVNAIWWWDTTGYFPGIPATPDLADDLESDKYLISLHLDLNNVTDAAAADFNSLYSADLQTFADPANDLASGDGDSVGPPMVG